MAEPWAKPLCQKMLLELPSDVPESGLVRNALSEISRPLSSTGKLKREHPVPPAPARVLL